MSTKVLSFFLKNSNIKIRTRFQVILQCAPFLKGLKVSCLISLERGMYRELEEIFRETGISYRILLTTEKKELVLFYREDELRAYLEDEEICRLIRKYGYEKMDMIQMLDRLAHRVQQLSVQNLGFPHEIGAFLGYPAEDVKGFIEKQGKEYLMIGYWKVYSNPSEAEMIFKSYDQAKQRAVQEFLRGKSVREIAAS